LGELRYPQIVATGRATRIRRITMLRRDTEYVLTWDALNHSWLARPIYRDGERILQIGPGATEVDVPTFASGLPSLEWAE